MTEKRAPRGEPRPFKTASGQWRVDITLGKDGAGKRIRRSVYGASEIAARQQARELQRRHSEGANIDVDKMTVGDYLTGWLLSLEVTMKSDSPRAYESYESVVRIHLIPSVGAIKLRALQPEDVERYIVHPLMKKGNRRTAIYARNVLRNALNRALKRRMVPLNAAALADVPEDKPRHTRTLSIEEARRVMDYPHRLRPLFVVAFATGMRMSELLGLEWQDVDLSAGVIHVTQQQTRVDGELKRRRLKTGAAAGDILIPPFVVHALRVHQAASGHRTGRVFRTTIGTPIGRESLHRIWTRLLARLGIDHVPFHDATRDTCATLLAAEGVPDMIIQSILRHAKVSTTQAIYIHVDVSGQKVATEAMQRILGS